MSDFIRRESEAKKIPALLASQVRGFKESLEFKAMRRYELDIPGVVCGAFARYLFRIHEQELMNKSEPDAEEIKESIHRMLEQMATSPELVDYVVDEIYENIECKPEVIERIKAHLKPNALALYRRWMGEAGI